MRCAGIKKHGKGQCCVWSGSFYADAAPLRRGNPFCHHHRLRCAGQTCAGERCTVTTEHAHADPLRQGNQFCAHHLPELNQQPLQPQPGSDESDADSDTFSMALGAADEAGLFSKSGSESESEPGDGESQTQSDSEWSDEHYNVGFSWGQD